MTAQIKPVSFIRPGGVTAGERCVAVEAPVSIEVDGLGYAVMMMTPSDLEAFAVGFMLTERLADTVADIIAVEPFETDAGWIVRIALADRCRNRIHDRVRHRTSDTSCGLCGIAGLEQLHRPAPIAPRPDVRQHALFAALANLRAYQPLNALTGAVHAAAVCNREGRIVAAYEDVGRHNALDKLIGGQTGQAIEGFILVTSRLSFEMVDKSLIANAPLLVGISAPTTLALLHAQKYGLTLIALARSDAMIMAHDPHNIFPAF
ncbi:formate dehydrogenase family accessory protein FdhD [Sphingomonas sp. Leaf339]|uniref:formate dehydrogenase accessory sulfurtransferase FdhD n=1 Tax=Sphingomonas sp. Leaf339 TaxID=1736343 RepID=UPI0006FA8D67|nr:formate dehydrogenase accessory sulfurtransferase FdhD [Sphingomonas sp. Leaf339]KQU62280.1 formate dehydrogenase family accessory protein FdhD [Sphingomonas sp. Leaf339]